MSRPPDQVISPNWNAYLLSPSFFEELSRFSEITYQHSPPVPSPKTTKVTRVMPEVKELPLGAFSYLDNLTDQVFKIETSRSYAINDMSFFRYMRNASEEVPSRYLGFNTKRFVFYLRQYLQNKKISGTDMFDDRNSENVFDVEKSQCTITLPEGSPRLSAIIRSYFHAVAKGMENFLDDRNTSPGQNQSSVYQSIKLAHEFYLLANQKLQNNKSTMLDKYLSDNVILQPASSVKMLINRKWFKYRGMFGDHGSCFYESREHGPSSVAMPKLGYMVRLYEANIPDEAILYNPDNPMGLSNPLNTLGMDNYDDREINGTDGCLGRMLIVPVWISLNKREVVCQRFPTNFQDKNADIGLINSYSHSKKMHGIDRNFVGDALTRLIPGATKTKKASLHNYGPTYINAASCLPVTLNQFDQSEEIYASLTGNAQNILNEAYEEDYDE
jgi:hypothetical protein